MKSRILLLFSTMLFLWSVVVVRGAFIQIFPSPRLAALKRRQFETSVEIRARRGAILDRNGKELAASVPAYSLFADPKLIQGPGAVAGRLARALKMRRSELLKHLRTRDRRFVWLRRQLPEKQMQEIKNWNEPGLGFIEESKRIYPNGNLMAQTLGFVGADGHGLEGLELQFDKELKGGLKTVLLPRDARGRPLLPNGHLLTDFPDGSDVQLTIDAELQFVLEQELRSAVEQHRAEGAVGIVMDPRTFEILAMANLPTFDLGEPNKSAPSLHRNRVVTDAFEPGSTMKAFLMGAALEQKVIRPGSRYFCENGRYKVTDRWITEADQHHKFGWLTATEILAHSSNIGVSKIAFDLGAENLRSGLERFGFGHKTGVDFPGESHGILNPLPWRPHLLANIAFGQGVAATPLQLAAGYSAIANGGFLRTPVIVKSVNKASESAPESAPEATPEATRPVATVSPIINPTAASMAIDPIDDATLKLMLMAATGEQSTGINARVEGYPVAGKTGTAQKVDANKGGYLANAYISSFAGMVPAQDPRFVIYVAFDNPKVGHYGSDVAAPVFSRIAQFVLRRAGVPPVLISEKNVLAGESASHVLPAVQELTSPAVPEITGEPETDSTEQLEAPEPGDTFPSLLGLTLREALLQIKDKTNNIRVRGHGWVVRSIPVAGQVWQAGRPVTLLLENPD